MIALLALRALEGLLALASLAQAADKQELQISGHAGFSALVERGAWTPVVIDLDHRGKDDLDVRLSVVWAQPGSVQAVAVPSLSTLVGADGPVHRLELPIGARTRKRIALTLRASSTDRLSCWVLAEDARGKTLAAGELLARSLAPDKRLIVTVGTDRPAGIDLAGLMPAAATPEHLPEDWRGYASVDTMLWLDAKASDLRSQAQIDALRHWVAAGGRLVVARASEVGLSGTPLADLLPVSIRGGREIPELSALTPLAGTPPKGRALVLETSPTPSGRVALAQDGLPLVVDSALGLGRVLFVALDPAREPFSSWPHASRFWASQLPSSVRPGKPQNDFNAYNRPPDAIGSLPIAQLAGQFPDVAPPAIGGLFALIVAYLVVVGPFDYFLLRKLKKLEWTWLTFPAYVLGFTLLILVAGGAFIERAAYQREMTVEDHLADVGLVRTRTLSSVLAPRNLLYTIRDAEPVSSNYLISNFQGGGFLELGSPSIQRTDGFLLDRWSVPRGATALVQADRIVAAPGLRFRVVKADDDAVELEISNPTGLELYSAALATSKGVYELPPIAPGDSNARGVKVHRGIEEWAPGVPANPDDEPDRRGGQSASALDARARQALLRCSFAERASSGFAESLDLSRVLATKSRVLVAFARPAGAAVTFSPAADRLSGVRMIRAYEERK